MIKKLKGLYMPVLCRSVVYSISHFIFYICFTIWSITIVPPYNYLVDNFKAVLIKVHEEGGVEKVRFFLYSVANAIMLITGCIIRNIYDCFYNDWYTYSIMLFCVYHIGRYLSQPLLGYLWEFWKDVWTERITDMERLRYDHNIVYDVDTMIG